MTFKIDFSSFERAAIALDGAGDQVPFALANAMNRAAHVTADYLALQTWPRAVHVRNAAFVKNALAVKPALARDFRSRGSMTVEVYDKRGKPILLLHAEGGMIRPRSQHLSIPPEGTVTRGTRGVRRDQRPAALIAKTPKRALRITEKGIFIGAGGRLHLRYAFASYAEQPADVPFYEDFKHVMAVEIRKNFSAALRDAMRTRGVGRHGG